MQTLVWRHHPEKLDDSHSADFQPTSRALEYDATPEKEGLKRAAKHENATGVSPPSFSPVGHHEELSISPRTVQSLTIQTPPQRPQSSDTGERPPRLPSSHEPATALPSRGKGKEALPLTALPSLRAAP